jgi:hypothetical protein
MAVSYKITDGGYIGLSVVTNSDTTAAAPLGTVVRGKDTSTADYGEAEFVYVKFTGTVAANDWVLVDRYAKTCVQSPASTTKGNYGISMAAQSSGTYGWVMVRGVHDAANVVTSTAAGALISGSATAGRASSAVANYNLDGALCKTLAASNVGTVELYYPTCSGR